MNTQLENKKFNINQEIVWNLPNQNKVRMFNKYYKVVNDEMEKWGTDNNYIVFNEDGEVKDLFKVLYINEHLVRDMDKWYKTKSKY